jgi:hypothetical protein
MPKLVDEAIGEADIQPPIGIEQADSLRAFPRLDNERYRPGVKPPPPLLEKRSDSVFGEASAMLLSKLELHFEFTFVCHTHDLVRRHG